MPGFDSTGPEGQGPRTGRQMGKCKPRKDSDESQNTTSTEKDIDSGDSSNTGRGFGRGRGFRGGGGFRGGFGRGRGFGRGINN